MNPVEIEVMNSSSNRRGDLKVFLKDVCCPPTVENDIRLLFFGIEFSIGYFSLFRDWIKKDLY